MEADSVQMQKGKIMFKVPNGQDPYSAIGKYIRDHITVIEDIIAVIKINEVETNQLFMVDTNEENYFIWETDWWEGEEDVTLIDFFPVSEAQRANQSVQSADTISRQAAIDALMKFDRKLRKINWHRYPHTEHECRGVDEAIVKIMNLPSAESEMIREIRKWIKSGNRGNADYFIVEKIEEIINKYE